MNLASTCLWPSMISPGNCMPVSSPIKLSTAQLAFFLTSTVAQCPYQIDYAYSDNGKEFKGTDAHAFVKACRQHGIGQKFTCINRPQTNGKAERGIRTLMDMRHSQTCFKDYADRRIQLFRFVNFYNTVKPHKSLNNATPYEILNAYFNQPLCKQP